MSSPEDTGALFVGVGARRGVTAAEVLELVAEALAGAGRAVSGVLALATAEEKAAEPGIAEAAEHLGVALLPFPVRELAPIAVPNPSAEVAAALGTPSVAEAAALAAAAAEARGPAAVELLVPKRVSRSGRVTCAVARGRLSNQGRGYTGEEEPGSLGSPVQEALAPRQAPARR
ncbi:cobalamin biosynthesis protein [Streptomyces sp. NPDC046887]|uniref:cobalamin biosynthesis protein n=1 Tax=Streptomyces sp. NPDC046887 TaxID=3155472 RepID=UPI0033D364B8